MWKFVLLISLVLAFPAIVLANAGSALLWLGIFHLFVLNGFIGIAESAALNRLKIYHKSWLIILGNYISMFIGMQYLAPHFSSLYGTADFWGMKTRFGEYNLHGFFAGMLVSYLTTLIVEFPFFWFACKNRPGIFRFLLLFFLINTLTNAIMFCLYYMVAAPGSKPW